MIFQDPMTSLNPLFTVEEQITSPLMRHQNLKKKEARRRPCVFWTRLEFPARSGVRYLRVDRHRHVLPSGASDRGRAHHGSGRDIQAQILELMAHNEK